MTRRALDERQTKAEWSATTERLRRTALALTRSADEADDLTQQTLVTRRLSMQPADGATTPAEVLLERRCSITPALALGLAVVPHEVVHT